jgi:2-phospho-L-lactate guanylyltransferase
VKKTVITVPMKDPQASKTRLSDTLDDNARARLTRLLYRRTLDFLKPIARQTEATLTVVTNSSDATRIAQEADVAVIDEPRNATLSDALAGAAEWAEQQGYDRLCIIPADLAAPEAAEVITFLQSRADVAVCPSADRGTNALLVSPPTAIPFRYGPLSAIRHLEEARSRGLSHAVMPLESLSFDIDQTTCLTRALRDDPELAVACQ